MCVKKMEHTMAYPKIHQNSMAWFILNFPHSEMMASLSPVWDPALTAVGGLRLPQLCPPKAMLHLWQVSKMSFTKFPEFSSCKVNLMFADICKSKMPTWLTWPNTHLTSEFAILASISPFLVKIIHCYPLHQLYIPWRQFTGLPSPLSFASKWPWTSFRETPTGAA